MTNSQQVVPIAPSTSLDEPSPSDVDHLVPPKHIAWRTEFKNRSMREGDLVCYFFDTRVISEWVHGKVLGLNSDGECVKVVHSMSATRTTTMSEPISD